MTLNPTHLRRQVPHRRRNRLEAEFLAETDGTAIYKVRFQERGRETVRFTSASMGYFETAFETWGGTK